MIRALEPTPADIALGGALVLEYVVATAEEVGQDVDLILSIVPDVTDFAGRYFPGGDFLVAEIDGEVAGGVGNRPGENGVCEMNRLWVRERFRRQGLGRALASASMDAARVLGFTRMHLDVVPERTVAIAMYRTLGFDPVEPAHEYPWPMVYLARPL